MVCPLVMTNSLLLKMTIEIVSFPINSMVIFHSYVNVYQRVTAIGESNPHFGSCSCCPRCQRGVDGHAGIGGNQLIDSVLRSMEQLVT